MNYLFTSESVSEGHPDKVADQISDAILDEFLRRDPESKVACETFCSTGLVIVGGEVRTDAYVDIQGTVREDGLVKKTYVTDKSGDIPKVEIVYENFLPIYCGYIDASGKTVTKTYYSKYVPAGRMMLPTRTTSITYTSPTDSSVMRTIYSDIQVDGNDPLFDFQVPSNAKVVSTGKLPGR